MRIAKRDAGNIRVLSAGIVFFLFLSFFNGTLHRYACHVILV